MFYNGYRHLVMLLYDEKIVTTFRKLLEKCSIFNIDKYLFNQYQSFINNNFTGNLLKYLWSYT